MKGTMKCTVDGCEKVYSTQSNLNAHKREDHGTNAERHVCHVCQESFKRNAYLTRHLLIHVPKNSWSRICPTCSKVCAGRKDNFERHAQSCARKVAKRSQSKEKELIAQSASSNSSDAPQLLSSRRERRTVAAKAGVGLLEGFLRLPLLVSKRSDVAAIYRSLRCSGERMIEKREISPSVGQGVFALQSIKRGDAVCEYAGSFMTGKVADERISAGDIEESFTMYFRYPPPTGTQFAITGGCNKSIGCFINHCRCGRRNNIVRKLIKDDKDAQQSLHIVFVASRTIAAGEELRYDYGDRRNEIHHPWLKACCD